MPLMNQIVSYAAVALLPVTGAVAMVGALFPGLLVRACQPVEPNAYAGRLRRPVSHRTAFIAHGTPINF